MSDSADCPPPLKNLVLIGFMGCGKSAISRRLSEKLGYPLFDTDDLIEKQEGRKISEIFASEGEHYFRSLETKILETFLETGRKKQIIATGGGIITRGENLPLLKKLGFVIWLDAKPETVVKRIASGTDRPLLQTDDPAETIRQLSAERRPLYQAAATMRMETDGLSFEEIVLGIVETPRYFSGSP